MPRTSLIAQQARDLCSPHLTYNVTPTHPRQKLIDGDGLTLRYANGIFSESHSFTTASDLERNSYLRSEVPSSRGDAEVQEVYLHADGTVSPTSLLAAFSSRDGEALSIDVESEFITCNKSTVYKLHGQIKTRVDTRRIERNGIILTCRAAYADYYREQEDSDCPDERIVVPTTHLGSWNINQRDAVSTILGSLRRSFEQNTISWEDSRCHQQLSDCITKGIEDFLRDPNGHDESSIPMSLFPAMAVAGFSSPLDEDDKQQDWMLVTTYTDVAAELSHNSAFSTGPIDGDEAKGVVLTVRPNPQLLSGESVAMLELRLELI
jgi:hypothetical protein